MRRVYAIIVGFWLGLCVSAATAQQAVTLLADQVTVQGSSILTATGNVEVFFGDTQLQASQVVYDQTNDQLRIVGPIALRQGDQLTILADAAELDPQLQNGILQSARMVLNQQVQLAAAEINLVDGRYTQLTKVAATSCHVCGDRPPLWQIRASRVVHDTLEKQIYFDNAQLRVLDLPIFWLPRLRIPDPSLERATGFLIPQIRANTRLGTGLKIPYFIPIGDHRDVTLTPYFSPNTRTLEARYRQKFVNGSITVNAAATTDDILPNEFRGYLFADGRFDFQNDFTLRFDVETTTDDAYLLDYGYSGKDRLDSAISISRVHSDSYFNAGLINYFSLRDTENNATQPTLVADVVYERRLFPVNLGGELNLRADLHSHYRRSDTFGPDGRDVSRLGLQAAWVRDWTLSNGFILETNNQLNLDYFNVSQDNNYPDNAVSVLPTLSAKLRWPLVRSDSKGGTQTLEPIAQIMWSEDFGDLIPNEESTRVEFDEGNLFALSKFPAADQRESGLRANLGLSWARVADEGWQSSFVLGRVFSSKSNPNFTQSSGLSSLQSDWLISGQLDLDNGLDLTARAILNDTLAVTKSEARLDWRNEKLRVGASYVYIVADTAEDRPDPVNELSLDGNYVVNQNWSTSAGVRYSFIEDRAASANLGLRYEHECVEVDFSASRRFTSSSSLEPSTDFDLSIGLRGFTANAGGKKFAHRCN